MGRAKLAMKLIENRKARNLTFTKRKKGLLKKAEEFSILCGVDTCLICYKKDSDQLITWPENQQKVGNIVRRYLMASKEERVKREIGLSLLDGKKLARGQHKSANQLMFPTWDDRLNSWSVPALHNLASILDEKIEMVSERIQFLRTSSLCSVQSSRRRAVSKTNFPLPPFPLSFVKPEEQQLYSANDFLHTQAAFGTSVMPMPNPLPHFGKFSNTNNFCGMSSTHGLHNQESNIADMRSLPPFFPESSSPTLPLFDQESSASKLPLVNEEVGVMPSMNSMMLSQSNECVGRGNGTSFQQQQWFPSNQYSGQSDFLPTNPQPLQTLPPHPQAHNLDQGWL